MVDDVSITVDTTIHELEVVRRVCYSMSDRAFVRLERRDELQIVAHCSPVSGNALPDGFVGEFHNALIDFGIRLSLARETSAVRDLIFRQAFVEADL